MQGNRPPGSVREGWDSSSKQSVFRLIHKLTEFVRDDDLLECKANQKLRNRMFRLLGTLGAELDLRLRDPANRYSVEKSMQSLAGLSSHPDIGINFAKLRNATCIEFGCGGLNPGGGSMAMLLAGAKHVIALDLDDIQSPGCAARSMYAVFGAAVTRTCNPPIPGTADQIMERVDSFDWNLLASGDLRGVDSKRLVYIQKPMSQAGIASASTDILVSSSVFEHLAEPDEIIKEMARIVRPGGLCMHAIDGVDHRSYNNKEVDDLEFLKDGSNAQLLFGCNRVRPLAFQRMFEEHGFEVRAIRQGEVRQLTDEAVQRFAPQFRELPRRHLEVLRARFYLRRR